MRRLLTALALVSPAIAGDVSDAPVPVKKIPAITLLPNGSELKGVMLPTYDKDHQLIGVLKSRTMTLVDAARIAGKTVSIEFFNPDRTSRGRIDLTSAMFYQEKSLIAATEPVSIKSDRLTASGSGLYYSFAQGRGFLSGPATTIIIKPPPGTP